MSLFDFTEYLLRAAFRCQLAKRATRVNASVIRSWKYDSITKAEPFLEIIMIKKSCPGVLYRFVRTVISESKLHNCHSLHNGECVTVCVIHPAPLIYSTLFMQLIANWCFQFHL